MQLRSLALIALVFFAGCSDKPSAPTTESSPVDDLGLQATSTTGIIRGVAVDDAIRPLGNVSVHLTGPETRDTVSNIEGAFGFDGLPAGTYFLEASKLGFTSIQQSVEVVAGNEEPPIVKLLLPVNIATRPYFEAYVYEGFVECTTSVAVLCGIPNLVLEQNVTNDRFTWLQYISDGATLVQSEMVWQSTQAISPQMYFEMEALDGYGDCDATDENDSGFMGSARGESPIMARINITVLEANDVGESCPIYYSIFSGGPVCTPPTPIPNVGTLNPICPGATVQQQFTMYIHAFYRYLPPEDWRFSGSPEVPQPPA